MASKKKIPVTPAIRLLRQAKVDFEASEYRYVDRGGAKQAADELGVDLHMVVKTLIMEDETGEPLVVLMHGDQEVSTKTLARMLNKKTINPCEPKTANKHSGYLVGGTSPFGTKRKMPVYVEKSILDLDRLVINGGKRGLQVMIRPVDLVRLLEPEAVEAAV